MFSDLRFRLRAIFQRGAMEQELHEELSEHIEREASKYEHQGMSRADAERRARIAFGGMGAIKEDARDARGTVLLESVAQDMRYAWRGLRARPGFTAAVLITLGLGIGANTAMFGIVDRLLFRPPPFLFAPERVHRVMLQYMWNSARQLDNSHAYKRYLELSAVPSLERTAVFAQRDLDVGVGVDAREVPIATVSASLFDFFSVRPALGRFFTAAEDSTPSGAQVVVLGNAYWRANMSGATDVLGKQLFIASVPYTIIGVAPPGFAGFSEEATPAAYIPVTTFAYLRDKRFYEHYGWTWLNMYARRRPGVSIEATDAELTTAFQRSWVVEGEIGGYKNWPTAQSVGAHAFAVPVQTARGPDAGAESRVAAWVMGVAVVVLLIACANVANLLLTRAASRRRETAMRLALGVSGRRLVQQLLTESILLAALGGMVGMALSIWGSRALGALFLQRGEPIAVGSDARTLLFTGTVTLAVALITGLAPALSTLRNDVAGSLKAGMRDGTYRRSRARTALLLFQGALSVVLLVGAGLFVRSLNNVRSTRLGFDVEPLVVIQANMRTRLTPAERDALGVRLISAATSVPGVHSATLVASIPFGGNEGRGFPYYPGADTARIRRAQRYMLQTGNARYFETTGTRILRGRGFTEADRANAPPVIVVNQVMADRLWPGQDPLGKQVRIGEETNPYMTVIGVAENMRGASIENPSENWYYVPWDQYRVIFGGDVYGILVRVNGRAQDFVDVLRRRMLEEMPGNSFARAAPISRLIEPRQRSWEFGAKMFVAFGALALGLAAIGLYSVIAYGVAQRSHELGVRMALGAGVGNVLKIIVGQGVAFALTGIVIGGVIALWAGKWIEPLLFAQKARDPLIFVIVGSVLIVAAIVATLGPAWRAMRVDPTVALRSE